MKKLIVAIFLFVVLINSKSQIKEFSLLDYFAGEYTAYSDLSINNSTDLGFCYMTKEEVGLSSLVGESMLLKNYEVGGLIDELNAEIKKTECLEDGTTVIYAFSNLIDKEIVCDNLKINLQIAIKNDYIVVGWPLILGSF